eukprot:44661-Rhodomonas_salina.1
MAMELAIRAAGVAAAVAVGRAAYVASYFRPQEGGKKREGAVTHRVDVRRPPGHQNQDPSRYRVRPAPLFAPAPLTPRPISAIRSVRAPVSYTHLRAHETEADL